jgi:cbb3-type cytochrome oxidase subunit 3
MSFLLCVVAAVYNRDNKVKVARDEAKHAAALCLPVSTTACLLCVAAAVYNRDNKLKVARDEAKHAAEQQELQERHRAAEAQARRKLLLQRARQRRAEALGGAVVAAEGEESGSDDEEEREEEEIAGQQQQQQLQVQLLHPVEEKQGRKRQRQHQQQYQEDEVDGLQQQQQQQLQEVEPQPVLEHINFWKEQEAKAQHPERQVGSRGGHVYNHQGEQLSSTAYHPAVAIVQSPVLGLAAKHSECQVSSLLQPDLLC